MPAVAIPLPVIAAVGLTVGVWLGEATRPWVSTPGPWLALAVLAALGALGLGHGLEPRPVFHPGRPAGWAPAGGPVMLLLLATALTAWGAAYHLHYVRGLRTALPPFVTSEDGRRPALLAGWVDDPVEWRESSVRFPLIVAAVGVRSGEGGGRGMGAEPAMHPVPWGTRVEVRVSYPSRLAEQLDLAPGGGGPLQRPFAQLQPGQWVVVRGIVRYPEPPRFPGAFDARRWFEIRGLSASVHVPHPRHVQAAPGVEASSEGARPWRRAPRWADAWARGWRQRVERFLAASLPEEQAAVLLSMMFGRRDGVEAQLQEVFQRSGLMHLLAVSGLHVGFVAGLAAATGLRLRLPRWALAAVGGAVIAAYVLAAGARPSAVRAGVAAFLGLALGRGSQGINLPTATAMGAIVLIAYRPVYALDLSFQLSFAAVLAIWAAVQGWRASKGARLTGPVGSVAEGIVISIAAQLAAAPLIGRVFGEVALLGPLANIVAVPLAAMAVPLGLVAGTVANGGGPIGPALAWIAGQAAAALVGWARLVAALPVPAVSVQAVSAAGMVVWYALLAALGVLWAPAPRRAHLWTVDWRLRKRPLLFWIYGLVAAVGVGAALDGTPAAFWRAPVELYFLDVGQGSAVLLRIGRQRAYLIDGGRGRTGSETTDGYDSGRRVILPALTSLGIRHLDGIVATHPHDDHVGGLMDVLDTLPVAHLWDNGHREAEPALWRDAVARAVARGTVHRSLQAGDVISLGRGAVMEVLHPPRPLLNGTGADVNNNSLVLRLVYRDATWLLTGDVEARGQAVLHARAVAEELSVRAQGFHVPHHGSSGALWPPLWDEAAPDMAVISVGRNAFGHPAPEVLRALERRGAAVYRTDRHGTIRAVTRGRGWRVRTWLRPCPDRPAAFC